MPRTRLIENADLSYLSPGNCDVGVPIEDGCLQIGISEYDEKVRLKVVTMPGQVLLTRLDQASIQIEINSYPERGRQKKKILARPVAHILLASSEEQPDLWEVKGEGLGILDHEAFEDFVLQVGCSSLEKMEKGLYEFDLV